MTPARRESKTEKNGFQLVKPGPGSLLQAINRLVKSANLLLVGRHKTRGLSHVNLFLKNTIEEGIIDIQLLKRPVV